jgi:hypothetical protein
MLMMLTSDRAGPLEEREGSLVGKGGESDVESWHLQGCSPHLCRLSIDGLATMRKYWMYWSHVGDMGPVKQCSMFVNRCLAFITASMAIRGEKLGGRPGDRSAGVLGLPRMIAVGSIQHAWKVALTGTARKKCTCGIRGPAQEAYVSCVSGFPYRMYIDSNRRDPQIWVTTCLVVVST